MVRLHLGRIQQIGLLKPWIGHEDRKSRAEYDQLVRVTRSKIVAVIRHIL
jgi:hypothetical protein